jgi:tetratricopeptide (TPR) repeat protein
MSEGQSILDNALVMQKVAEYVENKKILILDQSGTTRSQLSKLLQELGANRDNIFNLRYPGEAKAIMAKEEISIVLSEFEVDGVPSLPLFEKVMQRFSDRDRTLILVTKNAAQSTVAQAMEEEVDSYILKPFVYNYIKENLVKTFFAKEHPSTTQKRIFEARQKILEKKWDEAQPIVKELLNAGSKSPAIAYYLQGSIFLGKEQVPEAKQFFQKALKVQNSHFKSLNALYDIYYREEDYENALEMIEMIRRMLPLSPKKLEQLFVIYRKLEMPLEILKITADYKDLDEKHRSLIFTAIDTLLYVGKAFVKEDRLDLAHEAFLTAIGFSGFDFDVISQIVIHLVDNRKEKMAEFLLSKTKTEDRASEEFMVLDFKVNSLSGGDNYIFSRAKDLIKANVADAVVYEQYIEVNIKREKLTLVEQSLTDAKNKFSDNKETWIELEALAESLKKKLEASARQEAEGKRPQERLASAS